MAKITYKGITQNSNIEHKLTDEEFKQIVMSARGDKEVTFNKNDEHIYVFKKA